MHRRESARGRIATAAVAVSAVSAVSAVALTGLAATPANAAVSPGTLELISRSADAAAPTGESRAPSLTPNGRYVVFQSTARNLTSPGDQRDDWDVFVRDTRTGVTKKVSTSMTGRESDGNSLSPAITPNGRYVVFLSSSSDLVTGDEPRVSYEVFVKDLKTGKVTRIHDTERGPTEYGSETEPSISDDGKVVAFTSSRADLVPNDTNLQSDVFVWRAATKKITRVSVSSSGGQGGVSGSYAAYTGSHQPQISGDGKTVVFRSGADNLVKGDTNGISDIFVHTLKTKKTKRISVGPKSQQATGGIPSSRDGSGAPTISADGKIIAYSGFALRGIVKGDTSTTRQVYVHNRTTGKTRLVAPALADTSTGEPAISANGRFLGFVSDRADLVAGDAGRDSDVFVKDLKTGKFGRVSVGLDAQEPNGATGVWGIAVGNGGRTAFSTRATNLVSDKVSGGVYQVFLKGFAKDFWKKQAVRP